MEAIGVIEITEHELLEALLSSTERRPQDDGSYTVDEMSRLTGWGKDRVRRAIAEKLEAGELEIVKTYRRNIQGRLQTTVAWRPVQQQAN